MVNVGYSHQRPLIPLYLGKELLDEYKSKPGTYRLASGEGESKATKQEKSNQKIQEIMKARVEVSEASTTAVKEMRDIKGVDTSKPSDLEVWDKLEEPEKLVLTRTKEDNPDKEAQANFANLKITDEFYRKQFGIYPVPSIKKLRSYVHDSNHYNNAAWSPEHESIFFGNVDTDIFNYFTYNLEVTVHEFGHAVTSYSSDLAYQGESGALNESIADVFGIIAKQYHVKPQVKADSPDAKWLIGEGLFVANPKMALRSMNKPGTAYDLKLSNSNGKDKQVDHMKNYAKLPITEDGDWGGVHINSGIPNRAFYLAATRVGEYSWGKVGLIWHQALKTALPFDNFETFAGRTVEAAKNLGYTKAIIAIVNQAWRDVGVTPRVDSSLLLDALASGSAPSTLNQSERGDSSSSKVIQIACFVGIVVFSFWAGKRMSA